MNDFNALLQTVIAEAKAIRIPISDLIQPDILVNRRAKKRFGQCILKNGVYTIELSERLCNAPEKSCKQTIAHELIHTCKGCDNHGNLFMQYADRMNRHYGYHIKSTNSCEEMGIPQEPAEKNVRYILLCRKCGIQIRRERYSAVVAYPSRYHCRCGGALERIK